MTTLVDSADWALFAKNGTDATTTCLTISRAATGKKKILVARGSYHGSAPWCTPVATGVVEEDTSNLIFFEYNDNASLEAAVQDAGSDLAGIILTAFRHDVRRDQDLPKKAFLKKAREICDNKNAVLILDDVRAGFRLNKSGSWFDYGVKPDLTAFSKAIGNGYPLSAVVGVDKLRQAASEIYAPVSGRIIEVNEILNDSPDIINSDAEENGWIWKMAISDFSQLDNLMDKSEYSSFVSEN